MEKASYQQRAQKDLTGATGQFAVSPIIYFYKASSFLENLWLRVQIPGLQLLRYVKKSQLITFS